jgi:hypothetical protein
MIRDLLRRPSPLRVTANRQITHRHKTRTDISACVHEFVRITWMKNRLLRELTASEAMHESETIWTHRRLFGHLAQMLSSVSAYGDLVLAQTPPPRSALDSLAKYQGQMASSVLQ